MRPFNIIASTALLFLGMFLFGNQAFGQFSEDFESYKNKSDMTANCWEMKATVPHKKAAHNGKKGLRVSAVTAQSTQAADHYFRTPFLFFSPGVVSLSVDHSVSNDIQAMTEVWLVSDSGTYTFVDSIFSDENWQRDTIQFVNPGSYRLEFRVYVNLFGPPYGSHKVYFDDLFVDLAQNVSDPSNNCQPLPSFSNNQGGNDPIGTFPVEWLGVEATQVRGAAVVTWLTTNEVNNDYYVIERSQDGYIFTPVGLVGAATEVQPTYSYRYADQDVEMGQTYYYRIRQIDFDGKFSFSRTVTITLNNQDEHLVRVIDLMGNPVFEGRESDFYRISEPGKIYVIQAANGSRKVLRR